MLEKEGRLPDAVIACVGGGSNAIGSFYHFIDDKDVKLIGCEAAGRGVDTFETAATERLPDWMPFPAFRDLKPLLRLENVWLPMHGFQRSWRNSRTVLRHRSIITRN